VKSSQIPVACLQLRAHDRARFALAWPHVVARIDEAAALGARLIVLPEGTVPAYVLGHDPVRPAEIERAEEHIGELARRHNAIIVYGGALLADGRPFNAAIAVGPDGRIGHAAKQFLWHFDRRWFAPGETLEPLDTPYGKLGLLVCADGRIPTIAATLVERGAVMLVMPTAWVSSGRDPGALENLQADLMANVRARENGVPFAIANKCGVERESVAYCGKSALIGADGAFIARGSERDDEIVVGTVTVGERGRGAPANAAQEWPARRPPASGPVRIAFTVARGADVAGFAALAADSDADLLLARSPDDAAVRTIETLDVGVAPATYVSTGGVAFAAVTSQTFRSPRALVAARLHGYDFFVWHGDGEPAWDASFARTRAAELRAYVVVFADDRRAFAVDPDGTIVAGTFGDFRMASFVYDPARTAATLVAPTTDVLAGLRETERVRDLVLAAAADA
jgi:predicted amidohydrolase